VATYNLKYLKLLKMHSNNTLKTDINQCIIMDKKAISEKEIPNSRLKSVQIIISLSYFI